MGTDCAPVVANLFLFAYVYDFMKGLLKDNITLAIKFSNTDRYYVQCNPDNPPQFVQALFWRIIEFGRLTKSK